MPYPTNLILYCDKGLNFGFMYCVRKNNSFAFTSIISDLIQEHSQNHFTTMTVYVINIALHIRLPF